MTASANRFSTYTTASGGSEARNGEAKKDLWSSMLDSVASGKRLPEKNLLVLGGTTDSQREFLDALAQNDKRADRLSVKIPPVANSFALGYTYYDVLDTDQEDTLARISLYLLTSPSPSFTPLIRPLLTPETIPHTLIVVLLDWSQPHLWMRQLREWLLLLRAVLTGLSNQCKDTMEEVMVSWKDRGREGGSVNLDGTGTAASGEGDVSLPIGPGEWEDGLGLPLCVVCQNAERMEFLEKSQGWKEADFDQVLQYLRTVLLRHGASLIYTAPNIPSPLQSLVHASLGITSLLKRQALKYNVIDRDKIVVPPNWDSWGKIRVLRDGFDVEAVSGGWSGDLDSEFPSPPKPTSVDDGSMAAAGGSAITLYENWIRDPSTDALQLAGRDAADPTILEIKSQDTQQFLDDQLRVLEAFRTKANEAAKSDSRNAARGARRSGDDGFGRDDIAVSDHIGPVQFNMGGIQVDADDMLQRLKDRQAFAPDSPTDETPAAETTPDMDKDKLEAFFAGLMNRSTMKSGPR